MPDREREGDVACTPNTLSKSLGHTVAVAYYGN